jgi:hypothetical protein
MADAPSFFQVTDRDWIVLEHGTGIEIHGQPSIPSSITIHLTGGRKLSVSATQGDILDIFNRLGIRP